MSGQSAPQRAACRQTTWWRVPYAQAVRLALWALVSLSAFTPARAIVQGEPLLHRYSSAEVGAPPSFHAAAHDADGILYFGNAEGVLRFNGDEWTLLRLPGNEAATALATDPGGHVWVGGYDTLGWVRNRADGGMEFVDRRPRASDGTGVEALGYVWQLQADTHRQHGAGVLVRAESVAYWIDADAKVERRVPLAAQTRMIFPRGSDLLARHAGLGLLRLGDDGRGALLSGGQEFADQGVVALFRRGAQQLVVAQRGFYAVSEQGTRWLAPTVDEQAMGFVNAAIELDGGTIAIGTDRGYLLEYDAKLHRRQSIHVFDGAIEALHVDREGGLWVLGEGELTRLHLPVRWTRFGRELGLRGSLYATEWYDGALWFAGDAGLMRLPAERGQIGRAEHKNWFPDEGYALLATDAGMLVAHRDGLFVLGGDQRRGPALIDGESVDWLGQVGERRDRVLAVSARAVYLLALQHGKWVVASRSTLAQRSPVSMQVRGNGELWFIDTRSGVQRWRFDLDSGARIEDRALSLPVAIDPAELGAQRLFELDGSIFLATTGATYRYDDALAAFVAYSGPPTSLLQRPNEIRVLKTQAGTFALTNREMLHRAPGSDLWARVSFDEGVVSGFDGIGVDADGAIRVLAWDSVLQYENANLRSVDTPLQVGLAKIGGRRRDGSYIPLAPRGNDRLPTLAADAALEARFALMTVEPGVQFRYRLHGARDEWSAWSGDRNLLWQRPRAGQYSLEVQARTPSGREVTPLAYRFRIESRWYETTLARALLVTAALSLLFVLVQAVAWWRTQRLRAANALLERRIAERTEELALANRKLAELATIDSLTGVGNRRALEAGLAREWHRCLEQRRSIAALMIDVDHFKRFNDRHGHLEGDRVLREVAGLLNALHDPQCELLARFGGEEFVLILPGVDLDLASRRAETIRKQVCTSELPLTVSIGVAAQVPSPLDDPSMLLRRADAALYRAKRNGRDRVEVAND